MCARTRAPVRGPFPCAVMRRMRRALPLGEQEARRGRERKREGDAKGVRPDRTVRERGVPTPFHSQRIAHRGACGKALVVLQNRWPKPEPAEIGDSRSACAVVDFWVVRWRRTAGRGAAAAAGTRRRGAGAPDGLRRRRPQIGAADMNPLTTSAFGLPDRLSPKADPTLIADDERHFAAIAESLEQTIAELSDRLDAERRAPGGIGREAMERDTGDPPADRSPAHPAPLRPGPVPRTHGRRGRPRARVRRTARPHRQHGPPAAGRLALPGRRAVLRGHPRQPDGSGEPPQVPLDPRPDQRLLGRGVHRRRARRARRARRPVRLHRRPGRRPVGPDAGRARHHPGRPGRHHPRGLPRRSRRRRRSRARARPSSPCTAPPTSSTPTLASVTAGAACSSSVRTSPTSPTSPTSSPASARRACRPAPLRDLVAEGAAAGVESRTRTWPS